MTSQIEPTFFCPEIAYINQENAGYSIVDFLWQDNIWLTRSLDMAMIVYGFSVTNCIGA